MTLWTQYERALAAYAGSPADEAGLIGAFELGRTTLAQGHSLLDLLTAHHTVLRALLDGASDGVDVQQRLARANEFLAQVVAPFEMAQRGWHEMIERLRQTNEELERRVAERTAELTAEMSRREATHEALVRSQKLQGLGELAAGMAHDFNNLLTVIIGNLELLDAQLENEAARKLISHADEAAQMGARLIGRLLTFGRQRKLRPQIVNLNEVALGMMEILRHTIGEQIMLNASLAPELWDTLVDISETETAILNLAINARDAMPRGGRLIVETNNAPLRELDAAGAIGVAPGDYVRLSLSDTGSGMPPEVVARAFEPFFTTKEPGKGTGLGLATIHGFAQQSGGHVTIESEVGRGTTVALYLPRDAGDAGAPRLQAGDEERPPAAAGITVLVVEDNPAVRDLTVRRLDALGYTVLIAEDGPAAIAVLATGRTVNVVFSDVVMAGGMSGVDLARWLREKRPDVRVLLSSGFADIAQDEAAAGLNLKLLRKPYKHADLARAVSEVLEA
jgi:signal transduction histidine kinase/CheY-like chemotaxis protein